MTDNDRKESEMTDRSHIYQEIQDERDRQDAKWGGFKHNITHTEHNQADTCLLDTTQIAELHAEIERLRTAMERAYDAIEKADNEVTHAQIILGEALEGASGVTPASIHHSTCPEHGRDGEADVICNCGAYDGECEVHDD